MKKHTIRGTLKIIGDIFIPLLPGIICAGLCGACASLITQTVPDYANSNVWALLYQILVRRVSAAFAQLLFVFVI